MRALLVAASPIRPSPELLREHAASADMVVAVDGGAAALLDAGVAADLYVGDGDSIDAAALTRLESEGAQLLRLPTDKDESDLGVALDAILDRGCDRATVTGVFGGRLDHELAAIGAIAARPALTADLVGDDSVGWLVGGDGRVDTLRLTGSGATISIFALGLDAVVSVTGVTWPLTHRRLPPLSPLGLSNIIGDAGATITVHSGTLLVLSARLHAMSPATRT